MTETPNPEDRARKTSRNNGIVVTVCLTLFFGMIGMAYAAVPLYQMFCRVTGYGGTVRQVEQASSVILDKTIKVRFDGNVAGGLPWEFRPDQREITMRIGETRQIFFHAKNLSSTETTGQATFNVTPDQTGAYFNKIQCFCFTETTLKPGEGEEMPVLFFVDPDIVNAAETKGVSTITLSYTFYPHEKTQPVASAKPKLPEGKSL
jgi:cytochrome c oxidase assembly protein subunit 11